MGKTGINARNIRQDWLMRLLCNWLVLHTSEPVPEGADPQNPAPFFLPYAVTPESGGRVLLSTPNVAPISRHKPKV